LSDEIIIFSVRISRGMAMDVAATTLFPLVFDTTASRCPRSLKLTRAIELEVEI
jgi:hypothetical protein